VRLKLQSGKLFKSDTKVYHYATTAHVSTNLHQDQSVAYLKKLYNIFLYSMQCTLYNNCSRLCRLL